MDYSQAVKHLIWNLRLDYDPVGIRFIMDDAEIPDLPVTHQSKTRLTFCQFLAAVRQAHFALYMPADRCLCENAGPVFGFRELEEEADTRQHMKYFRNKLLAWLAPQQKARLPLGTCKGIFMAPLADFDKAGLDPSVAFVMCVPFQAYHLLNDYMAAMKKPNLTFFHTPNSAVCAGSVWAHQHRTANMTTMCAGSKTSGKTEMNHMNVFIPGDQFLETMAQQVRRVDATGGPSLLGEGGQSWPGLDACKGCPMFKFEKV